MVLQKFLTCDHQSQITDSDKGEVFCGNCGEILQDKTIDANNETQIFNLNDFYQTSRTGSPIKLSQHDGGLNTVINSKNIDSTGRKLPSKTAYEFNRLRTWDNRSKNRSLDRTFAKAFTMLDAAKEKLGLPNAISEQAAYIFRKAVNAKISRGRITGELTAAAIYAACRQTNTPRTLHEVSRALNIPKKRIAASYRILLKTLDIKTQPQKPSDYLPKICSILELSEKTKRYAYEILQYLEKGELIQGSKPTVICAAALYLSCIKNGEERSQGKISEAAGISSVALRNVRQFLGRKLNGSS
ncbi:MAG: transcription initiation factor IIB [Nitrosopumilaceae archaeon]